MNKEEFLNYLRAKDFFEIDGKSPSFDNHWSNKETVKEAVQINGIFLAYASDELKADKDIVALAIEQNINALKEANEIFRSDKEFVLKLINQGFNVLGLVI
ncbi:hypothetical protein OURE66S_02694 [Oligella ureolytica]